MTPRKLWHFYRVRLRTHLAQEVMAGVGIAIGVALVFAIVVANTSISTSARQIIEGIAGDATLQLDARDERGFGDAWLDVVRSLPSVRDASGVLEQRAIVSGTNGTSAVVLVGVDSSLIRLGGPLTQDSFPGQGLSLGRGVLLPREVADRVGVRGAPGNRRTITLRVRGRVEQVRVAAIVGRDTIGPLAGALVAVARLSYVQELAALPVRLSRIFIVPQPGKYQSAYDELVAASRDWMTVSDVDRESRILAQASAPSDQSTGLFAAISAIVGFLLAVNAMLLTMPERRRALAELRIQGFAPHQLVMIVVFQAIVLGTIASGAGLLLGWILARQVFADVPTYLSFAFPLGAQQTVEWSVVVLTFLGGVGATVLAAAQPLGDLLPNRATDSIYHKEGLPGHSVGTVARRRSFVASVGLVLAATALVAAVPEAVVPGMFLLGMGVVLALPATLAVVTAVAERIAAPRRRLNMLAVAARALRATRLRAFALAATGAVAVFGSVAIEGAHRDLERGLHQSFEQYLATTDLWITTGGDDLTTESFIASQAQTRVRNARGVASVRPYFGGLLDIGQRRAWVIARSARDRQMLPASEVEQGDASNAEAQLRRGLNAVAVSSHIAAQQHASVGDVLELPTPTGTHRFRVVAILTNLGWGPGAIILNAADYRRAWATNDPTALQVELRSGVSPQAGKAEVERALGPGAGLRAQTVAERHAQYNRLASDGLSRLTQISILLLAAAAIALATAAGAAIWQRRAAFDEYQRNGFVNRQLLTALLIESSVVLTSGCALGAVAGIYGQFLLGHWLRLTTGFPASFTPSLDLPLATVVLVVGSALLLVAPLMLRAVRFSTEPRLQH